MSRTHKAVVRDDTLPDATLFSANRRFWVPKEGQNLLIELPNERLMAVVAKVVSPDVVICELTEPPLMFGKTHHYTKGQFVPCERAETPMEIVWRAFQPRPAPPPDQDEPQKPRQRRKRKSATKAR